MKLNKILMVLAATAIVGCTSEDLNDFSAKQAPEDSRMIELNENFILAGVGAEGSITRTHWEQDPETKALVNKFLPIYESNVTAGNKLSDHALRGAQAVGLCWLGQTPGAEVYTNYQFFHYGWLNNDETEADVDNCDPFTLYNGALYSDITMTTGTAGKEAIPGTDWVVAGLPTKAIKDAKDNLNYNSGVYKTENKTIFGGKYIVYYPYNPEFQETGAIPAKADNSFEWNPTADTYESAWLGEATFRYSAPVDIEGGMNAANFGLYNLSTLVRLRVFTGTAGDPYNTANIDKVVLYSPSGKFVKQAYLGPDKIAAGKQGQELYAGELEYTKTITTNFTAATSLNVKKNTTVSAYFTVLPTTVDDLVALVHATKGTETFWYRVELDPIEFKAGNGQVVDILVKEANITSDYVVVDQASLQAALTEAEAEATESNPVTISLIGDVTLTGDLTINQAEDRYITIDGGDIIVPQGKTLTLTTLKEMKSNIRVLGKDCCSPAVDGGRLIVNGTDADKDATILHNVTLEKTEARVQTVAEYNKYNPAVTYDGNAKITIADDAKVTVEGGNVNVNTPVDHKGAIEIGKNADKDDVLLGAKVNVNNGSNLKFMGDASKVTNNGIIEVFNGGQFNMTDAAGNSTYKEGLRMTNNGKFIHNVGAGVGTAVQYMDQKGEYRCKVNNQVTLNNAYKQWFACNIIEIIQAEPGGNGYNLGTAGDIPTDATAKSSPWRHNNDYIDIEIASGVTDKFSNEAKDSKGIKIGALTIMEGATLNIEYAKENDNNKQRTLTVNGDMTVNGNTTITSSKMFTVTENLKINDATLTYAGGRYGTGKPTYNKGLAVTKNIEVSGETAVFDAAYGASDALNITCANFLLSDKATAKFGNQTDGGDKTMTVSGTIANPKDCKFLIASPSAGILAWITCTELVSGGTYEAAEPLVVAPAPAE